MQQGQILFLNERQIQSLVTKEQTLELVEGVFRDYAAGNVVNPVKLHLPIYPDCDGYLNSMPSYNRRTKATGVKLVTVYHDNPKTHQLLATLGTIVLHDWQTGLPYAIMGGTHITNLRTGAAAGLKAKYLAREDAQALAVIGAGAQGYSALEMVMTALGPGRIRRVYVSDLVPQRREQFIEKAKALYPQMDYVSSPDNASAMEDADVALFCAAAPVPLLEGCPVKEGAVVVCVNEMLTPKAIEKFDAVYTDFTACVLERFNTSGRHNAQITGMPYEDLTEQMITAEFGDVVLGKRPGRSAPTDRILTTDVGMSIEDVAVAQFVYEQAVQQGVGQVLDFENL